MAKSTKAGRNELCPCGSGKKFKKCCAAKQQRRGRFAAVMILLVAAAVVGAIAYGISSRDEDFSTTPAAGRVWSPEHGHWH
jgi:hypothetical protein